MSSQQKVVVIAGASQGIGASLVKGFCQIGYAVVANSRSMRKIDAASDPAIVVVDRDIAAPSTAECIVFIRRQRYPKPWA